MQHHATLNLAYRRSRDQDAAVPARHAVVVVGAGPVGLSVALDLANQGVPVLLLDEDDCLSAGSRAICFAKRTLEIFDRLGCGDAMVAKGVGWNRGKVFLRDELLYAFDLLPEAGHERPAFINLQQYHAEAFLIERARGMPGIELRFKNRVTALDATEDGATLTIETPEGAYRLHADWLIACDGSRSPVRGMMGVEAHGQVFDDRFLIADVRMQAPFPAERWFWFVPPFHRGQSVLLHRQPDDIWRIDFQLGAEADPVAERDPARVIPRIQALLGLDVPFTLEWVSVYTFACRRMERFRHGRVLFAGDAAHTVSPFGARGANGGVQDAENLAWKLALVLRGRAPDALLDSYGIEREYAADENILNSTRSTDFITPKTTASRTFRDAALSLARDCPFARRLVNSGRLSLPAIYRDTPLSTPDTDDFAGAMVPGAPAADAPVRVAGRDGWLLRQLREGFCVLHFADRADTPLADALRDLAADRIPIQALVIVPRGVRTQLPCLEDHEGLVAARYDARPGTTYLIRPDQHIAGRMRRFDVERLRQARDRACARA